MLAKNKHPRSNQLGKMNLAWQCHIGQNGQKFKLCKGKWIQTPYGKPLKLCFCPISFYPAKLYVIVGLVQKEPVRNTTLMKLEILVGNLREKNWAQILTF